MENKNHDSCPITPLPEYIGPYKILRKIASGGMGEVFLAQDPFCKRSVALKKIRSDKINHPGLKERFLKEVKIAALLSHPSIIPIYQIHQTEDDVYYTMPLIKGETLKEIIKTTLQQEKNGEATHPIGSSIPALMRIFLSICQAIAYSHDQGIIHKDLKPENIIIGPYGEVLILDWGLATFVASNEEPDEISLEELEREFSDLTKPGKIAGTLSYLPPERIFGSKASFSSDIYALGVILYQLLTLRSPFHRKTIKEYRRQLKQEKLIPPSEKAPYRDIPPQLAKIAKKCLSRKPEKRYASVEEILIDLNKYIEGHAEWVPYSSLQVERKADWKFQENVLLAKHIALTQKSDLMEWVSLMIAKDPLPEKIKLETHVHIKEEGRGIGFLLNMHPNENEKNILQDGFFLWIGSEQNPGCYLLRSNVELMSNPSLSLKKQLSHFIRIEKTDHHIRLYIDNLLAFDYLSYTPFSGPYFGVILKDDELEVGTILVSSSSPNIQVNCLAVPDALLAVHQFKEALSKYRQIANSFAGRSEGKEALFRAGITLLEEAQSKKEKKVKEALYQEALKEFDQFREGSGSPLEYLGKSLVYKATHELQEELKCLELALRRFHKHPLTHLVKDQILFRLHEASYKDKTAAYEFALLTLRQLPEAFTKKDHLKLLEYLQKHCEELPFLSQEPSFEILPLQLAFYLAKPLTILDILANTTNEKQKVNALYCLLYLGYEKEAVDRILSLPELIEPYHLKPILDYAKNDFITVAKKHFSTKNSLDSPYKMQALLFFLNKFSFCKKNEQLAMLEMVSLFEESSPYFKEKKIEFLLYFHRIEEASFCLETLPISIKQQETSPFHLLQTCIIGAKEGLPIAKKTLFRFFERNAPPFCYLIDFYFNSTVSDKNKWLAKAFFWEKIQLLTQLSLLYRSTNLDKKYISTKKQIKKEYKIIHTTHPL